MNSELTSICQIKNNRAVMKIEVGRSKPTKSRTAKADKVEPSSGNVFADVGFRDAEERMWKAQLCLPSSQDCEKPHEWG
jgi:hypothetical protein